MLHGLSEVFGRLSMNSTPSLQDALDERISVDGRPHARQGGSLVEFHCLQSGGAGFMTGPERPNPLQSIGPDIHCQPARSCLAPHLSQLLSTV
jgi:hypothetical protein